MLRCSMKNVAAQRNSDYVSINGFGVFMMLAFFGVFLVGIAALVVAQQLDIECVNAPKPAKNVQPKASVRPSFEQAVTQ